MQTLDEMTGAQIKAMRPIEMMLSAGRSRPACPLSATGCRYAISPDPPATERFKPSFQVWCGPKHKQTLSETWRRLRHCGKGAPWLPRSSLPRLLAPVA